jgi:PAS domain S-box-containing protein
MSELIDNSQHRIDTLKHIIRHLHAGAAPDQVRARLADLVAQTSGSEIAAMEQQLMAEGMSVDEIRSMCDLHSQVLRGSIRVPQVAKLLAPGHPADTMRRENAAVRDRIAAMQALLAEVGALAPDADRGPVLARWRALLADLLELDKHYARKENLFFSVLERHGIAGPSKVMWAKDDEVRALLRALRDALDPDGIRLDECKRVAEQVARPALAAAAEMVFKEENILLPMCLETFTDEEWGQVFSDSPRYGWCLAEPRAGYEPPRSVQSERAGTGVVEGVVNLPTGSLDLEQLVALFGTLPVDLTFVDADDRVRFFSEGPERIFARSRTVIGRKVQNCHPPASVGVVERILSDFREGRRNVAEFWIKHRGKLVHIRYFAVRAPDAGYLGTLEVTQDLTPLRALEGERRLLQFD